MNKILYSPYSFMENTFNFKLEGGHCLANCAMGDDWFTVYLVETLPNHRNKGECTRLLKALKDKAEEKGQEFRLFCPMNPIIEHICEKLNIEMIKEMEEE